MVVNSKKIKSFLFFTMLFLLPFVLAYAYLEYCYMPSSDMFVKVYMFIVKCILFNFTCCAILHTVARSKLPYLPLIYGISVILFYMFPSESMMMFGNVVIVSIPISLIYAVGFMTHDKIMVKQDDN